MTRGKRPSFHPDGKDVVLLVRSEGGAWHRPSEDMAPRFHRLQDALRWLSSQKGAAFSGERVTVVRVLDMLELQTETRHIVALKRPNPTPVHQPPVPAQLLEESAAVKT